MPAHLGERITLLQFIPAYKTIMPLAPALQNEKEKEFFRSVLDREERWGQRAPAAEGGVALGGLPGHVDGV